jgi:hypothetical protein
LEEEPIGVSVNRSLSVNGVSSVYVLHPLGRQPLISLATVDRNAGNLPSAFLVADS